MALPCGREGVLSPSHPLGSLLPCSCSGEMSHLDSSLWTCRCHTSPCRIQGSCYEDLGVPWWFVPGAWVAGAVSRFHSGAHSQQDPLHTSQACCAPRLPHGSSICRR